MRKSAVLLRRNGKQDKAHDVERFADNARLEIDEPAQLRWIRSVTRELRQSRSVDSFFSKALEGALHLTKAERGNIQVLDPVTGSLRIIAHTGFDRAFLDYFAVVDDGASACGRASRERSQTVIADVDRDEGFVPHREIARDSGFQAVQSTPLIDRAGRMVGVVSTHYHRPYRPPERELMMIRRYAELVADALGSRQRPGADDNGQDANS